MVGAHGGPSSLRVWIPTDIAVFARRVRPFLENSEELCNMALDTLAALESANASTDVFLAAVIASDSSAAGGDEVVGVGFHHAARKCVLTEMPEAGAVALAEALAAVGREPSGVNGPVAPARAFAERWLQLRGGTCTRRAQMGLFALRSVSSPRPVPGRLVRAASEHEEVVARFDAQFWKDVAMPPPPGDALGNAQRRVSSGKLYLWQLDDGRVVSMAMCVRESQRGATVSLVYTPAEHRGRGYASNCVAGLCRQLLSDGKRFCTLYADLNNPTSTGIYRALGFEQLAEVDDLALGA